MHDEADCWQESQCALYTLYQQGLQYAVKFNSNKTDNKQRNCSYRQSLQHVVKYKNKTDNRQRNYNYQQS